MKISSNNEDSLSAWTQHAEQWTLGVISVLNPSVCRVHLCFVSDGGCPVYYNLLLPRRIFSAWENRSSDWVFHHRETNFTVTQSQHNHSTDSAEAVRKFSWFVHVQLKEEVLQVIKQRMKWSLIWLWWVKVFELWPVCFYKPKTELKTKTAGKKHSVWSTKRPTAFSPQFFVSSAGPSISWPESVQDFSPKSNSFAPSKAELMLKFFTLWLLGDCKPTERRSTRFQWGKAKSWKKCPSLINISEEDKEKETVMHHCTS